MSSLAPKHAVKDRLRNKKRKIKIKGALKLGKNSFVVTPLNKTHQLKFSTCSSTEEDLAVENPVTRFAKEEEAEQKRTKKRPHKNGNKDNLVSPVSNDKVDNAEKGHKNIIRQKLASKRFQKGLIMLSPKAEAKIYKLKKALHKKGLPENEIKQIIRQKRRSEELNFRNSSASNSGVCFRCRKPGHKFAECKLVVQDTDQSGGVCFCCGSTEHILKDCPNKAKSGKLLFARCFVCSQQGHLSRECPSNPKGAYPKGGKCNLCGSINHLKRDCQQLNETTSEAFTLAVGLSGTSADALDDN